MVVKDVFNDILYFKEWRKIRVLQNEVFLEFSSVYKNQNKLLWHKDKINFFIK